MGVDPALLQPLLARRPLAPSGEPDSAAWALADALESAAGGLDASDPPATTDSWSVLPEASSATVSRGTAQVSHTAAARVEAWYAGPISLDEGIRTLTPTSPPARPIVRLPPADAHEVIVLRGIASWYDNGTTAMRWPRGARIRICGPANCVNRSVTDWGPDGRLHPDRVVDLMPVDFVRVCGCSLRIGLTYVTVQILG